MRAVVVRDFQLVVDTVADPVPQAGEVLVRTLACGICGSDLHALKHAKDMVETARETETPFKLDPARDLVMGHEFCAEVVDFGPGTSASVRRGDRVVSIPLLFRGAAVEGVGYSNEIPGGFGELMVLSAPLLLPVPAGLATEHAALTEPFAVGVHAVAKATLQQNDAALVVGCGPVGLAVIAALTLRGVTPIVASDYSPLRRDLARRMGAHVVVDPRARPAIEAYREVAALRPTVMFECVGTPGMLQQVMRDAPHGARIVVAGVCMEPDVIRPMSGITKELMLQFVFGYTPEEFAEALRCIAEARVGITAMATGRVGLESVPEAFEALARPDDHAKILVEPGRTEVGIASL